VWEETVRIVDDLIENVWENEDAVVSHGVDITLPVSTESIGLLTNMNVFQARTSRHRGRRQADPDHFP